MQPRFDMTGDAPELYQAMRGLEERVRKAVDPILYELVKIRASQLNGCAFCIDMHTKDARAAGETEQRIYALSAWRETPFFTESERAALALTEAVTFVHDGQVPDDVYDEAAKHFERSELVALVWGTTAHQRLEPGHRHQPESPGRLPARARALRPDIGGRMGAADTAGLGARSAAMGIRLLDRN